MNFDSVVEIDIPDEHKAFVEETYTRCKEYDVAFQLINNRFITGDKGEGEYNGWFSDHHPKRLSVACDQPIKEWMIVLIHESCHMDQWLENDLTWGNWRDYDEIPYDEMTDEQLESWCRRTQALEKNCEQRAVNKIYRNENLKSIIDIAEYAQKANAYIVFHRFMMERKKFYDLGKEPYNIENIWTQMPDHFDFDAWNVSDDLLEVFRKHL